MHTCTCMYDVHAFSLHTASADLFESQLEERRHILSTESRSRVCPHVLSGPQVVQARGNETVFQPASLTTIHALLRSSLHMCNFLCRPSTPHAVAAAAAAAAAVLLALAPLAGLSMS
jgi:hypothetical protein